MGDTERGLWPKENCSDCGEVGVVFLKHLGSLVPMGAIGFFCVFCWNERELDSRKGKTPIPLGRKPFIEACFIGEKIRVITESNSVYRFGKPDKEKIRTVVADNKKLPFSLCRIRCLKESKPLYLIPIGDDKGVVSWVTTKVLSIEE